MNLATKLPLYIFGQREICFFYNHLFLECTFSLTRKLLHICPKNRRNENLKKLLLIKITCLPSEVKQINCLMGPDKNYHVCRTNIKFLLKQHVCRRYFPIWKILSSQYHYYKQCYIISQFFQPPKTGC